MKLLTIIVTYNAMPWIVKCIPSVMSSNVHSDIIVVDNGSTDGTQEYIKSHFPDVILYQSPENLFFGKGNNVGIEYAVDHGYDYVYLLNQDAWVSEDVFERLLQVFKSDPSYGILSPMQLSPDMKHCEWYFAECVLGRVYLNEIYQDVIFNRPKDVYPVDFVMAAHWMISRDCFCKVGGFSPTFPHYGEDDNYCSRTRYHQYKIGIVPEAYAVHDASNKPQKVPMKKYLYKQRIAYYTVLSDITNKSSLRLFHCFSDALKRARKIRSLRPLWTFAGVLCDMRMICRNNKMSKYPGAFLTIDQS